MVRDIATKFIWKARVLCIFIGTTGAYGQSDMIKVMTDLGTRYDYAYSIAIQSDGKVLVSGDAWGTPSIIRFDTTGFLDQSFGSGGKVFTSWDSGSNPSDGEIKIQSDGKIVLGTRYHNGDNADFVVARFHEDGSPDLSFGDQGRVISPLGSGHDWCNTLAIQADGKILAAGSSDSSPQGDESFDFAMIRYHSDGTIDHSFGDSGIVTTHIGLKYNIAYSMVIQEDDKIILAGEANDSLFSDFALVRYLSDGSMDSVFGKNGIVRTMLSETDDIAKSVLVQADGKILAAGSAQDGFSNQNCALVRYNQDGSLDDAFGSNGIAITDISNEMGNSVALQSDNKIVLAGLFTNTTIWKFALWRYHMNGAPDESFGSTGMITASFSEGDSEGQALAIGEDGEILVAGSCKYDGVRFFDFALLRLFSNLAQIQGPSLLYPVNEAKGQPTSPTMIWSAVPGASSYNIQISTSPDFSSDLVSATGLPHISFTVNGLTPGRTYFWRVSSNGVEGTGGWSEIWHFSVDEASGLKVGGTKSIKVYPIPVDDKLYIEGIEDAMTTVTLLSLDGKSVIQKRGVGINTLDLHSIPNGIYLLRILKSGDSFTSKIIKQ